MLKNNELNSAYKKLLSFEDNDLLMRTLAHTGIIVERIEDNTRDKLL